MLIFELPVDGAVRCYNACSLGREVSNYDKRRNATGDGFHRAATSADQRRRLMHAEPMRQSCAIQKESARCWRLPQIHEREIAVGHTASSPLVATFSSESRDRALEKRPRRQMNVSTLSSTSSSAKSAMAATAINRVAFRAHATSQRPHQSFPNKFLNQAVSSLKTDKLLE